MNPRIKFPFLSLLGAVGHGYLVLEDHEMALNYLEKGIALNVDPENASSEPEMYRLLDAKVGLHIYRAETLLVMGKDKEARDEFKRVLEVLKCQKCEYESFEIEKFKSRAQERLEELS